MSSVSMSVEVVMSIISRCGLMYNFEASEAVEVLKESGLWVVRDDVVRYDVVRDVVVRDDVVRDDVRKSASTFSFSCPLPYSGLCNESNCRALRQNNGLYTQCKMVKKNGDYCKTCSTSSEKNGGIPEYGTIDERMLSGINEYVDPKGRKPVAFVKIMKKFKVSEEEVKEEATRLGIVIADIHFVAPEETKRGRPASVKSSDAKEPKGAKGRPKKEKKVLEIGGEEDDLFASLVASANPPLEKVQGTGVAEPNIANVEKVSEADVEKVSEADVEANVETTVEANVEPNVEANVETTVEADVEADVEKVSEEVVEKVVEAKKQTKKQAELEAKQEKKKADLEAKEEKKKADLEAKELAKQEKAALAEQKKAEMEKKKADLEQKKKEKAELAEKKKSSPKKAVASKKDSEEGEEEEEEEVVKKIEVDGKKYLKSKKSGIIYDYTEYVKNGEQVILGKWNDTKNKIDFQESAEESEDEYDDEE